MLKENSTERLVCEYNGYFTLPRAGTIKPLLSGNRNSIELFLLVVRFVLLVHWYFEYIGILSTVVF